MRIISTKVHGILDYVIGFVLMIFPYLFDLDTASAESYVPFVLGCAIILYSIFTDYELGLVKKLSVGTHLFIDTIAGIFLAISPWVMGFSDFIYAPHLVLGLSILVVSIITETTPRMATVSSIDSRAA